MPYADLAEMILRWGEAELVRLTVQDARLDDLVDEARVARALADASSMIDGYLRARYRVPLAAPIPAEIVRAACILARHDLATGEQKEPSDQMKEGRREVLAWLRDVADGRVRLDGAAVATEAGSAGAAAMVQDRAPMFQAGGELRW